MPLNTEKFVDRLFAVIVLIWMVGFWGFVVYFFGSLFATIGPIEFFSELMLEGGEHISFILALLFIPFIWLLIYSFGSFLTYQLVFRRRFRLSRIWKKVAVGVLIGHALFLFGYWFGFLGFFSYPATTWSLGREVWDARPLMRLCIRALVFLGPSLGLQSYLLIRYLFSRMKTEAVT